MHIPSPRASHAPAALLAALVFLAGACSELDRPTEPAAVARTVLASASENSLPHINNTSMLLPATISADLVAYECSNNPGPQITFSGLTILGGYGVEMLFTNNMKGTHSHEGYAEVDATVMEAGEEIVIPKQPVRGGTGGNPFIWVQFINGDGTAASDEIFVGRCVQGAGWHVNGPATTLVSAFANFAVTSCENSPGPYISLGSGMTANGLIARIIFRNNDNPVGGPHEADAVRDITMIAPGLTYTFPKQPVLGGVGGNPWIFAAFADGDGIAISEATLLGRCEQLSKALN
jgi:hypothetical protein